jgi:hypothetical protein
MEAEQELKAVKLLQARAASIGQSHAGIASDLAELKRQLAVIEGAEAVLQSESYAKSKAEAIESVTGGGEIVPTELAVIYAEAEVQYPETVPLSGILSVTDFAEADEHVSRHVLDFNRRYSLDRWDYAIAGSCGLFAAMLDLLCVRAPPKPTTPWIRQVDGIFNKPVQAAFNKLIPPELSKELSKSWPIGAPDSSTVKDLLGAPSKALNPENHRLRSLAHDPLLGFIFGVWDMRHGTCTTVVNGTIQSISSRKGATGGTVFQMLGRMLGHLISDVNAPTSNENRGMGLPAPFMALLRMLEAIPVGKSNFGKQIEFMFVNGYDFRQFMVSSVPMTIMEVLMRVFYVAKQMKLYGTSFGEAMLETVSPGINPRFRMMLAIAYGTSSAVNGGKMYVTGNILNANYASWLGLTWNGSLALKWALLDRHLKLWGEIEAKEIAAIEQLVEQMDALTMRAASLPI